MVFNSGNYFFLVNSLTVFLWSETAYHYNVVMRNVERGNTDACRKIKEYGW